VVSGGTGRYSDLFDPASYTLGADPALEKQSDVLLGEQYIDPNFTALLARDPQSAYRQWKEDKAWWQRWFIERPEGKVLVGRAPSCPVRHGRQSLVVDTSPLITRDPLIGQER
jgi:hypothetical protein